MKFYTTLPLKLKPFFYAELEDYAAELAVQNMVTAWKHLERAHILGQKHWYRHTLSHYRMFFYLHHRNLTINNFCIWVKPLFLEYPYKQKV